MSRLMQVSYAVCHDYSTHTCFAGRCLQGIQPDVEGVSRLGGQGQACSKTRATGGEEAAQRDTSARQQVEAFQSAVDALSADNEELRARCWASRRCVQLGTTRA